MQSAETMQAGFARLKQELSGEQAKSLGKILMATVEGDIHDIGKNIVCTLLENHGFEVFDIGKTSPPPPSSKRRLSCRWMRWDSRP